VSEWKISKPVTVRPRPERSIKPSAPVDLARLRSALDAIPNHGAHELSYDEWRNVIFAIHHATGGSDEGLAQALDFSSRSPKHDANFLKRRVWPYIRSERSDIVTDATIYAYAHRTGWQDPALIDDFEDLTTAPGFTPRFTPIAAALFSTGKPMGYWVKGLIPKGQVGVMYGESGAGKSFAIMDIAMCVARGEPWRGMRVNQGAVVYIAAEGAGGVRNRLKAYAQHHEVDLSGLPLSVIADAPNLLASNDVADLVKALRAHGPAALVICDTLAQMTAGGNENSGEDMGKALAHAKALSVAAGGAMVILVHHSGKDSSKGARGWSGIKGAVDTELEVIRSDSDRAISVSKQKDGEDGAQFGFRLLQVPVGIDEDGDVITSCVVEQSDTAVGAKVGPRGAKEKMVMDTLKGMIDGEGVGPKTTELIDATIQQIPFDAAEGKRDKRREHVLRALESLVERGAAVLDGGRVVLP